MRKVMLMMALMMSLLTVGCTRYAIRGASDHQDYKVTALEVTKMTNHVFWTSAEHVFWMCRDEGDTLVCKRRCGGDTDLECPAATGGMGGITSNVR